MVPRKLEVSRARTGDLLSDLRCGDAFGFHRRIHDQAKLLSHVKDSGVGVDNDEAIHISVAPGSVSVAAQLARRLLAEIDVAVNLSVERARRWLAAALGSPPLSYLEPW